MNIISIRQPCITVVIAITIIKLFLIPSYRSTDFDVHRNWLAITKHLPLSQWYFDNNNGTTVHTLDYPPSFSFFEYFLANNFITTSMMHHGYLDERCLALLGDHDNDVAIDCVVFQRCTVIVADIIFLLGAMALSRSLIWPDTAKNTAQDYASSIARSPRRGTNYSSRIDIDIDGYMDIQKQCFILVVCNSGLILLDHIHFQYNGMLLGVLMGSLACLMQGIKVDTPQRPTPMVAKLELVGSVLFALLLTLKHLYLTLGPIYFFYLLHKFCFRINDEGQKKFDPKRLVVLGTAVLVTLMLPFLPFFMNNDNKEQLLVQMISRLFPFQRGLCHDYWAGNIWALYLFAEKVCNLLTRKHPLLSILFLSPFPEIRPIHTATCLLIGLVPAIICAWKAASVSHTILRRNQCQRQKIFLCCVVYSSMTSFMLAYHVHEKAIMTAIIPMAFLAFTCEDCARLFLRMSTVGHFGLMPLLYEPAELFVKVLLNGCYLALGIWILEGVHGKQRKANLLQGCDQVGLAMMVFLVAYAEGFHTILFGADTLEFLPLMMISFFCAIGMVYCWIQSGIIMVKSLDFCIE